ncbi:hypothetical protein Tco_1058228 [Tanacetum coccineum]|uniref:Retrotransposon gag domain-containing protein n=1 Tax=Tanacetum coccineum TaxID=301880 RepID=A0ABQ5H7L4_9ASTR
MLGADLTKTRDRLLGDQNMMEDKAKKCKPPEYLTSLYHHLRTPENTPYANHVSISANPNSLINPTFVEANYEALESLLRERRRQMHNEDILTKLEYYIQEYDEEREMEPRPAQFEEAPNRDGTRVERESEGRRPSEQRVEYNENRGEYPLPYGLKMPSYVGSYDGKGDPDNYFHLFEGAIRMQKWEMLVACHMFTNTLKDFAQKWLNNQKAGSIVNYEDLKAKFRSHFSQQLKFTKIHLAVHNIKQRLKTRSLVEFLSTYLPTTYKGLMQKTYTWIEAKEVATNRAPNITRGRVSTGLEKFSLDKTTKGGRQMEAVLIHNRGLTMGFSLIYLRAQEKL